MFEIGNTLREARVRRNLTLQQVEEDTKIRVKYVQAMENEDFDIMPGAAYVKGFLRTYCTYLGLDPEVIIGEYRSRGALRGENVEPFAGSSIIGKPRSHRGRNTIVFVAVVCLLVLAVIYLLGMKPGEDGSTATKPGALGIASASPSASAAARPAVSPSAAGKDVVEVKASRADCWLEVRRNSAEGTVLFSGTLGKGHARTFEGKDLWLSLGAPAAVDVEAGGKKIDLGSKVGPWTIEVIRGRVLQGPPTQG